MKTNYRKIDIYTRGIKPHNNWVYECSTNTYLTCKSAKQSFINKYSLDTTQVKANYSNEVIK